MTVSKKNIKKSPKKSGNQKSNNSESNKDEQQILKAVAHFKAERRREFEKTLEAQADFLESEMRGQIPEIRFDDKNYQIKFALISSRIPLPIDGFVIELPATVNEWDFVGKWRERVTGYLNSKEYLDAQKKLYHKLRLAGVDFTDIYPQIELRYLSWDYKEQKRFRDKISKDFKRKKDKKGVDEKSDLSTHSE